VHMFHVDFITNHPNGLVQQGKVLVVADSHEQASDVVCMHLNLPPSRTRCDSYKIKPPLQVLSERQFQQSATRRRESAPPSERSVPAAYTFNIQASNVIAHSEGQALRKIGEELQARGARTPLRYNLELSIDTSITERGSGSRRSTLEAIEFYRPSTKPMPGGRVSRK